MSEDMNTVNIIGRLTRDAELQYTTSGFAICVFSLANNYRRKKGEAWEDEVNFVDVKLLGKQAEAVAQYLTKGKQIAVTACLRQERWDQEGSKRSKIVLIGDKIEFLGSKDDSSGGSAEKKPIQGRQVTPGQDPNEYNDTQYERNPEFKDDIPF